MMHFNKENIKKAMEKMNERIKERGEVVVVVHDGFFHADDAMCVAELKFLYGYPVKVIRTRQITDEMDYDWMLDVGRRDEINWETGRIRLDHHQMEAQNEKYENGAKYCAYSKLIKVLGADAIPEYTRLLERKLVMPIAAADNGQQDAGLDVAPSPMGWIKFYNIPGKNPAFQNQRFEEVVKLLVEMRKRIEESIQEILKDLPVWKEAVRFKEETGNTLLIFKDGISSWTDYFWGSGIEDKTRYIIFPHAVEGWVVRTVPVKEGSTQFRYGFPKEWIGYDRKDGDPAPVDGLIFCHANGFMAVFDSLELAGHAIDPIKCNKRKEVYVKMGEKRYQEVLEEMKEYANSNDTEMSHNYADNLLIEVLKSLGYIELADVYSSVKKWYA